MPLQSLFQTLFPKPAVKPVDTSFDNFMDVANRIAAINPAGLRELVRALLLPLQAETMVAVSQLNVHCVQEPIQYLDFFFPIRNSSEFYRRDAPKETLSLARDVVLPTPWKRNDYINALATIGTGKCQGHWQQDPLNHSVSLVLPWRIGFVSGGNHSITAGILMAEGEIVATEVFDMTELLQTVRCDGKVYREIGTDRVLGKVGDVRRAAVFEIGRLMIGSDQQTKVLT